MPMTLGFGQYVHLIHMSWRSRRLPKVGMAIGQWVGLISQGKENVVNLKRACLFLFWLEMLNPEFSG